MGRGIVPLNQSLNEKAVVITDFTDENGIDRMKEQIQEKYNRIKVYGRHIAADELQRIQNDPALAHLIQQGG